MIDACPETYAKHLAGYIGDVSTIRVRTLERFGKAPPVQRIAFWRNEAERLRNRPWNYLMQAQYDSDRHVRFRFEPEQARRVEWQPSGSLKGLRCADEIMADIARGFGLTLRQIRSPDRLRAITNVRHLIAMLMRERGNDYAQIGRWLNREHSTIIHSCQIFSSVSAKNPAIAKAYAHYRSEWGLA